MRQCGRGTGFLLKARQRSRAIAECPAHQLNGYLTPQTDVYGDVDSPHPPFAEFTFNSIRAEHRARPNFTACRGSNDQIRRNRLDRSKKFRGLFAVLTKEGLNLDEQPVICAAS